MKRLAVSFLISILAMSTSITANAAVLETNEEIAEEIYQGELQLLACVVQAEAGNQDMMGKRLVVDAILNRVDSPEYPDTISDVVYQSFQFSCVKDGNLDKAFWSVTDECFEAVTMEIEQRTDSSVLYFTAGGYGQYGTPAYKYGDHYFSR